MSGTVNVDTLVETVRVELAAGNLSRGMSALSDLAARARAEKQRYEHLHTDYREMLRRAEAAEAAEADGDRLREELAESRRHADGMARAPYGEFESMREARDRLARRVAELEAARERCPACTHEWRRHDPEDGKCDAGSDDLGECPCGRDISFHRVRNAALSVAALEATPLAGDGGGAERATICEECGSGILDGKHIADYPCSRRAGDGGGA